MAVQKLLLDNFDTVVESSFCVDLESVSDSFLSYPNSTKTLNPYLLQIAVEKNKAPAKFHEQKTLKIFQSTLKFQICDKERAENYNYSSSQEQKDNFLGMVMGGGKK